jgi:hypothetical protein
MEGVDGRSLPQVRWSSSSLLPKIVFEMGDCTMLKANGIPIDNGHRRVQASPDWPQPPDP